MSTTLKRSVRAYVRTLALGAASAALVPQIAVAQEPAENDPQRGTMRLEEVVVTGTQMRGVDPVGAEVIGIDVDAIAATGASTTAELLASVPQMNTFGTLPAVLGGNNTQLTVNRVNIRNLPQGIGAASPTLLLLDGHRLVGAGVQQNYPDPDIVPPHLLQRVEVLTDGGSSVYGADAIGGVVNFITRKDIDGIELSLKQGFGDSYDSTDVSVTAGKDWGNTSAAISYNYQQNDNILGKDRGYVKDINWTTGVPNGRNCSPANVTIGGDVWAVNPQSRTLTPGTSNACDTTDYASFFPESERDSLFGNFSHSFGSSVHFDLQAWYTQRDNISEEGPIEGNAVVTPDNPLYISTGGATGNTPQNVAFDFSPVTGRSNDQKTNLKTWGFTPEVTWDFTDEWQVRAYYNYGYSETSFWQREFDAVSINQSVAAGLIDPYNVANSDPAAIDAALDRIQKGDSEQELHNVKAVFDGPIYELPGGEIRVAVGAEYLDEHYKGATQTASSGTPLDYIEADRDVSAYFAELNVPIVGLGNQLPGIYELTVSLAYRYDDYSDFGSTDSPNYAITYMPTEWLTLRGRMNDAFQAPGLADLASANAEISVFPFVPGIIANPAVAPQPGQWLLAAQGTRLPLQPQTAENWNVGFDVEVPFVDGLEIGMSMYHIEYAGQISLPPIQDPGVFYPYYTDNYLMNPSNEEAAAYLLSTGAPADEVANALATIGTNPLYAVVDVRRTNLGFNEFEGYDLFVNYTFDAPFGTVWTSLNGTYVDTATNQPTAASPKIERAGIDSSQMNAVLSAGTYIGNNISLRGSLNYQDGYDLAVPAQLNQTKVDSWTTLDLYAQYTFDGDGWTEDLSLSLGATNVFDEDPPLYRGESPGATLGYVGGTLGRVISLGIDKKF